jgi:hypothetical protein
MDVKRVAGRYRRLFNLPFPVDVKTVYAPTDWMGIFYSGMERGLILINEDTCKTEDELRATILHEFIHAEQWCHELPVDHGPYFQRRAAEIEAATGHKP